MWGVCRLFKGTALTYIVVDVNGVLRVGQWVVSKLTMTSLQGAKRSGSRIPINERSTYKNTLESRQQKEALLIPHCSDYA